MPTLIINGNLKYSFGGRNQSANNIIQLTPEAAINLLASYVVENPNLAENRAGLYSFANVGRDGKARFLQMKTPRHLLSTRKKGCQWNPKGSVSMELTEFDTGAVEYNGEQCPDFLFDDCLERMFTGTGNQKRDIQATPEGAAALQLLLSRVFTGLGNSIYDLLTWANHPLITQSASNAYWQGRTPADEWDAFIDQQTNAGVGGHMATLDALKLSGLPHLNVPIQGDEYDGAEFTGDVIALFNRLYNAAKYEFKVMLDSGRLDGRPVMAVTRGIFDAYEEYLVNKYDAIPEGYQLRTQGSDGILMPISGMLMWKGIIIMRASAWEAFYNTVGITEHRAILAAPGVFGIAYDTEDVVGGQFDGAGMEITQWTEAPYKGKIFMDTTFRLGGSIVDSDFVTMASVSVPMSS